jgi:hypothetical protein
MDAQLQQAVQSVFDSARRALDPITIKFQYDYQARTWRLNGITRIGTYWETDLFPADSQAAAELEAAGYLNARLETTLQERRKRLTAEAERAESLQVGFVECETEAQARKMCRGLGVLALAKGEGGYFVFLNYKTRAAWLVARQQYDRGQFLVAREEEMW